MQANFYVEIYPVTRSRRVMGVDVDALMGRKNTDKQWRWRAVASGNGERLAHGESYSRRIDCKATVHVLFGHDVDLRLVEA